MNKQTILIQVRQMLNAAEMKISMYKNEVIIDEYLLHVNALKKSIESNISNRAERAKMISFLTSCCPIWFNFQCYQDTFSLMQRIKEIRNHLPSLIDCKRN